jgi:NAD(P)-dependent dehydrogenase (short-subunit alcohol dehydrogenase family)
VPVRVSASLEGQVIAVTGGAGLLGRAFCVALSECGATSVVVDIDHASVNDTVAQIRAHGGSAEPAIVDITSAAELDALITELRTSFSRLDGLVNSAYPRSTTYGRELMDVTYESFCENVNLHLGGYFLASQRFAYDFQSHGGGCIVNVASIYGLVAPRFHIYDGTGMTMPVEYAAIKAGIIHLTRYFAQFFKAAGIRCNAIAPGGLRDEQPQSFIESYGALAGTKGLLDPQDVVGTLTFLVSDAARFINGQVLVVDDGWTL